MSLSQYLDLIHLSPSTAKANETYYLFGNNFSELFKRLEEFYVLPPCTHCKDAGNIIFTTSNKISFVFSYWDPCLHLSTILITKTYLTVLSHYMFVGATTVGIGGKRSGVSFHFHGPGFAEVITGRKLFFLYPPGMSKEMQIPVPPNLTMSQWVNEIYPFIERKQFANPDFDCVPAMDTGGGSGTEKNDENIYDLLDLPITLTSSSSGQHLQEDSDRAAASAAIADHAAASAANADSATAAVTASTSSSQLDVPPSKWLQSLYECVLEPGDMLYFPDQWQHATLNLDPYNLFVSVFLDLQLVRRAELATKNKVEA